MGKNIAVVSFISRIITGKRNQAKNPTDTTKREDQSDSTVVGPPSTQGPGETSNTFSLSDVDEEFLNQPLPPPPGWQQPHDQMRTASTSTHHRRSRSSSAVSRLTSNLSLRVLQSSRREEYSGEKNKKKNDNEDLVWKKTIILGEKCKVPDNEDDDDTILYDEKGKKISSYHPKITRSNSVRSFSRQNSATTRL